MLLPRKMDMVKRVLTFFTFFVCCAAMAFLTASLSTHHWIVAKPVRVVFNVTNITAVEDEGKFRGEINFGLFKGEKRLNYGLGLRPLSIDVKPEMSKNPQLMVFGLWLFTVLSLALSLLFGIVSAVFSIINTVMTPVEVITGVIGLYLWNGIAALFSLCAIISWAFQYYLRLAGNVMSVEEVESHWVSRNRAWFGYSFWFVVVSLILYLLNVTIVTMAIQQPWEYKKPKSSTDKNPEGVIMLY